MWQEWVIAFGLLLVIEGILPAFNPRGFHQALQVLLAVDEQPLRVWGIISMALGAVLIYLVH